MNDHTTTHAVQSTAEIATEQATRYLTQLCKHFQHKLPVTLDAGGGHITFTIGECRLHADGGILRLSLAAPDDARMLQLQDVVVRHLIRFAFREPLQIAWSSGQRGPG